jgi:DNA-binding CsgD family transcriptional regulator
MLTHSRFEESLALFRRLSDQTGLAYVIQDIGFGAIEQGEPARARLLFEESLALFRESGNEGGMAWSLYHLGRVFLAQGGAAGISSPQGNDLPRERAREHTADPAPASVPPGQAPFQQSGYARADALLEESLALFREVGDKRGMAFSLLRLAQVHFVTQTEQATVSSLLEESLALFRESGEKVGLALCFSLAGQVALSQGDARTARTSIKESLRLYREMDHLAGMIESLALLARVATLRGDGMEAYALFEESLALARKMSPKGLLASCLEGLASLVVTHISGEARGSALHREPPHGLAGGSPLWAARLWGAAEALREAVAMPLPPVELASYERAVAATRTQLGEQAFGQAWAEGRALTPEQAFAAHRQPIIPDRTRTHARTNTPKSPVPSYPNDLTEREVEVLRLVARGLSDVQVAEILVISPRTVNAHLRSIYSKLGIASRHAATLFALQHQLI